MVKKQEKIEVQKKHEQKIKAAMPSCIQLHILKVELKELKKLKRCIAYMAPKSVAAISQQKWKT